MPEHYDVVIIGGGAIGLCAAYYLSLQGAQVALLERSTLGSGCSDKNAGLIVPSHVVPLAAPGMVRKGLKWMFKPDSPFYIKPRLSWELLTWLWQFNRSSTHEQVQKAAPVLNELLLASRALFDELEKVCAGAFELTRNGLLMLYNSERAMQAERQDAELAQELGQQVDILQHRDLEALLPEVSLRAVGGTYYQQDAHLDPAEFIAGITRLLNPNLVKVMEQTTVQSFEHANGRIKSVRTNNGEFTADNFVLAGGAWSPELVSSLSLRLPIQAGKGYSVTMRPSNSKLSIPMMLSEAKVAVTPLDDRVRFAGTMELSGLDLSLNQRRIEAILRAVPEYLPDFESTFIERTDVWGGLRPCTPDGLPCIGRTQKISNLIVATGHAMLGISLAPITGKLVAEIVEGKLPSLALEPFGVERFR